jgi:FkbM family methyltransferase
LAWATKADNNPAMLWKKTVRHRSQFGQDALVGDILFKGKPGIFVDVGARDGITISNSVYLERKFGWTGIAIEPHPDLFAKLVRRRRCDCRNVAASASASDGLDFVKFLEEPFGNSGLLSTFREPERLKAIKHEIIRVPCEPLSEIIGDLKLIHYLDIDVEGHELAVLQGIDFSRVEIRIIGVEVSEGTPNCREIDAFLLEKNFYPFTQLHSDRFYNFGSLVPSMEALTASTGGR